jgi:23S rRNA pseudouridine1911/1915/1917 synthase
VKITIPQELLGERLDKIAARLFAELSRTRLQQLILTNHVFIDSTAATNPAQRIKHGETIEIIIPEITPMILKPDTRELDILYEDEQLIVLNKPAGLVVHPGAGNQNGTLVHRLLHHCGSGILSIGGVERPGIVHRLDKDTSGIMVVAKTDLAHRHLSRQFAARTMERAYLAICHGIPSPTQGTWTGAIGRHPQHRQKMAVLQSGGRPASTSYSVLEQYNTIASLVRCRLHTGRTHQIRVHFSHHKYPLIGDPVYGRAGEVKGLPDYVKFFPRQALHAFLLGFTHPITGEVLRFERPAPEDFEILKKILRPVFPH